MKQRRATIRRIIARASIFLLLGAIVNIAVAWGLAARRASLSIERHQQGCFVIWDRPWQVVQEGRPGMIDVWWYDLNNENPRAETPEERASIYKQRIAERQLSGPMMPSGRSVELLAREPGWGTFQDEQLPGGVIMGGDIALGWPCVGMWMGTTCGLIGNSTTNEQLHGGWLVRGQVSARGNNFVALPYRIIWSGFALNTLFYAAILWLLFAAVFKLRRKRRIQRGLCPACAYPVGASPVCTECGKPIPSPSSD